MQQHEFRPTFPELQVRAGVLVVDGWGITLRVLYGKLHVEDGIGPHRRSLVIDRTSGLERLALLGKSGSLTLEALYWLRAVGAALVHLSLDGALVTSSVPFSYEGHPIRRAQGLAPVTGLDVKLAHYVIAEKIDGQRKNLVRLQAADLRAFDELRESLDRTATVDDVRLCEAQSSSIYWRAWSKIALRFRTRDLARIPAHWARYDSRASLLTGAPRAATNPVNCMLNWLYSCALTEVRIALLAAGADPSLGWLHLDQRNRDSAALDCLEVIRPAIEAYVLDLLEQRTFSARDFIELPNGVCHARAPLTHELALTLPRWRLLLQPVVAHVAAELRAALLDARNGSRSKLAASNPSPLTATPRRKPAPRPYGSKAWAASRPEPIALFPVACARCGKRVIKRRRRHCDECMPIARREHGMRAIERARAALQRASLAGTDPRSGAEVNRKRGESIAEQRRRNRQWKREHPEGAGRDTSWFLREIMPKLDDVPLSAIARVTGLSLAACSRYRAGARVPHPRHWHVLVALVEGL